MLHRVRLALTLALTLTLTLTLGLTLTLTLTPTPARWAESVLALIASPSASLVAVADLTLALNPKP